ncbi:MAG: DUF4956 domain-containing protein [Lachnospiraceae bacterium]|nr:DUF4956 domain-containing protein [Lachnospiraceae bacterium]
MSTKDILKNSFLESIAAADVTPQEIFLVMFITTVLALYIFCIYRVLTRKTFYNKSFNITLAALALITAGVILTIQSSIVVSLGMVGALSIVRFRTAVKDPMDLAFLFWAISIGIICGARLYVIAVIVSIFLTILFFVLDKLPVAKAPKILVVNADGMDAEDKILEVVERLAGYYRVKSRSLSAEQLDMVVELRVKEEKELVKGINGLEGVHAVSLLAHDGEVTF